MFNNRMLAVAAVLVMAVPALGAATPIVVPPVPEQLVEGHTVFTVIEIVAATATNETRFAAAVAVLVREYQADNRAQRFPGVLWFNDQYLVNPTQDAQAGQSFRYPCGGAVMAVNAGDPDPRMVIARVTTPGVQADLPDSADDETGDVDVGGVSATYGDDSYTYDSPPWTKPYGGTYSYGNDYAWIGAEGGSLNATNPSWDPVLYSDTVVGATLGSLMTPFDYEESYLITDPNDHSWIIDKYEFYTRDGNEGSDNLDNFLGADPLETEYAFPVWVVNMLGTPVFVTDNGIENCTAYKDLIENVEEGLAADATAISGQNVSLPNKETAFCGQFGTGGAPPYTDDPCAGYSEPSQNGYCYGGQDATEGCYQGPPGNCDYNANYDGSGPAVDACTGGPEYVNTPARRYNALLYFKLEDLYVADAPRDHSAGSTDTNGCSEEQVAWGPNPPQAAYDWPCPGGDDNAEGNSHAFHPAYPATTPPHTVEQDCADSFYGPNPANHGGSTYVDPTTPAYDGWYQVTAPCDFLHATRNIDVYFSPGGRPFIPPMRNFALIDLDGSSAPYQDYHCSYDGLCPNLESS